METRVTKLKLALLSIGFIMLSSCTSDVTGGAAFWKNPVANGDSPEKEKEMRNTSDKLLPIGVLPIFFGTIEATLRSN